MKNKKNMVLRTFGIALICLLTIQLNVNAQQTLPQNYQCVSSKKVKCGGAKKAFNPTSFNNKEELLFISGMVKDAVSKQLILTKGEEVKVNGTNGAVVHASFSKTGHYSIAINKNYLANPAQLVINIAGYQSIAIADISDLATYKNMDLLLTKNETVISAEQTPSPKVKMNDTPFSPFIMKL